MVTFIVGIRWRENNHQPTVTGARQVRVTLSRHRCTESCKPVMREDWLQEISRLPVTTFKCKFCDRAVICIWCSFTSSKEPVVLCRIAASPRKSTEKYWSGKRLVAIKKLFWLYSLTFYANYFAPKIIVASSCRFSSLEVLCKTFGNWKGCVVDERRWTKSNNGKCIGCQMRTCIR